MAEGDQPEWRSGVNTAQAERIIKGVESLIRTNNRREGRMIHVSTGLSELAESLRVEGKDPKWRQEKEVIQGQIERGRDIEMRRIAELAAKR